MDKLGTSMLSIVQEVEMYGQYIGRGRTVCPLQEGCPLFRVSIIRGSTVLLSIIKNLKTGPPGSVKNKLRTYVAMRSNRNP